MMITWAMIFLYGLGHQRAKIIIYVKIYGPISLFFGFLVTIDFFCLESGLLSYFCHLKLVKKNKEKDIDLLSTLLSSAESPSRKKDNKEKNASVHEAQALTDRRTL